MTIEFIDKVLDNHSRLILISDSSSKNYPNQTYLELRKNDSVVFYEIKYETHCSPFKEVLAIDEMLAIGHEAHFYLVDTTTNQTVLQLEMDGYFGHLYSDSNLFYVADASGLRCIDKKGNILWTNPELGIDGVVIHEFTDNKILGSGEFDPPGGWEDFAIDKKTGIKSV